MTFRVDESHARSLRLGRAVAIVLVLMLLLTVGAAAANEIRIVTFNLLHGGPWSEWTGDDQQLERRFAIVAGELQRLKPEIVALQEASIGRRRGNVAARLAPRLGLEHVHARATDRVFPIHALGWLATRGIGFAEGPAILSRYPIVESEIFNLPRCRRWYDPRVLLGATVRTPAGDIRVYSTHTSRDDCQIARIGEIVTARGNGLPSFVMGDFNTADSMAPMEALRANGFIDVFREANTGTSGATVWQPVDAPTASATRRVDFVLALPGRQHGVRVLDSKVVLDTPVRDVSGGTLWPSDHYGVFAIVEMRGLDMAPHLGDRDSF
jgi:endonuclease/exonuclease/phosphatase family metal-dependent hydrolase